MSNKENIAILLGVLYCRLLLYSIHSSLDFMASILYIVIDKRSCLLRLVATIIMYVLFYNI